MLRIVLLLGALGGVWLLWRPWTDAAPEAPAGDPALANVAAVGEARPGGAAQGGSGGRAALAARAAAGNEQSEPAPASRGEAAPVAPGDPKVGELISALQSGRFRDARGAFAALAGASATDAERLRAAIAAAASRADCSQLVDLLGATNAFLHCEPGRQLLAQVLPKLEAQPPEAAVAALSAILGAAMRGPLAADDVAAQRAVATLYAALQRPLQRTVLNPAHHARSRTHEVQPGEVLDRIARTFRKNGILVDAGTIAAFNRIRDPRRLRAGQVLKVPVDPVRVVVEKRSFLMAVYVGDAIVRLYRVGHGKDDCTPEATFVVASKHEHPDWYADGRVIPYGHPDNVLGDYFVKFEHPSLSGFGAHGTSEPDTVGKMASAGCLRLLYDDIDFFHMVPIGATVEIRAHPGG
jgi:lipoprotein-anchoring transpeptidase ErfK/SrfK